jgi:hypothetical protein
MIFSTVAAKIPAISVHPAFPGRKVCSGVEDGLAKIDTN